MDNAAIEALLDIYDLDIAHAMWLEYVIGHNLSEELVLSQLDYIEELICDDAFYGIIETMLEPYKEQYPLVYSKAWNFIKLTDSDDDSIG